MLSTLSNFHYVLQSRYRQAAVCVGNCGMDIKTTINKHVRIWSAPFCGAAIESGRLAASVHTADTRASGPSADLFGPEPAIGRIRPTAATCAIAGRAALTASDTPAPTNTEWVTQNPE
ncbi:unnamed protein product, partial [Iphiclides podalirius]